MRRDNIPYVPNVTMPSRPIPLENMDLQTIAKLRLRSCTKSNGRVSVCRDCETKCADGRRAVELQYGTKSPEQPSLFEEKILQKMNQEKQQAPKPTVTKDGRQYLKGWYEEAAKQNDPLKWIMDTFELSKTGAKKKIAAWNTKHPDQILLEPAGRKVLSMQKEEKVADDQDRRVEHVLTKEETEMLMGKPSPVTPEEVLKDNQGFADIMRKKIETLTADRENYKQQADKWMALYKGVEEKITALTMALEAFSE